MAETSETPAENHPEKAAVTKAELAEITTALRTLTEATRKANEGSNAAQRKLVALAGGAMVGAIVSAGIVGLVGMRSIADLREAAQIQAAAGKVAIEQVGALTDTLATASLDQAAIRTDIATIGAELKLSLQESIAKTAGAPDMSAVTRHVDQAVEKLRTEIITAIAELSFKTGVREGALGSDMGAPELAESAPEEVPVAAPETVAEQVPVPEPAPKPAPKTEAKVAPQKQTPRAVRAPAVDNGAFAYP